MRQSDEPTEGDQPQPSFRVFDATCLIVGIIIGAGLYETAPQIAGSVSQPPNVLGLWLLGGLISLAGAFCYTELATTYPRDGGDVVYLSQAYGRWAGFLFGWMQLTIVRPGDISLMAFVFARYVMAVVPANQFAFAHWASAAVVVFTLINLWGVHRARRTQNLMTIVKLCGLLMIIGVGLMGPVDEATRAEPWDGERIPVGVALVLVLFCYGGWNEIAYVAAEVHDPRRNIVRAMLSGMGAVIGLYLLANFAFLNTLGHAGVAQSSRVAVDVLAERMPRLAEIGVAALIAVSALGSLNGQILTGARVSFAAGEHYRFFRWLGHWNAHRQTPVEALVLQMLISLTLINVLASFADTLLYTALPVYMFYFFSSLSVIVLRRRDRQTSRAFRVPGYPWTVLVFMAACLFMIYSAYVYRPMIAGISLIILLAGLPLYFISQRRADS